MLLLLPIENWSDLVRTMATLRGQQPSSFHLFEAKLPDWSYHIDRCSSIIGSEGHDQSWCNDGECLVSWVGLLWHPGRQQPLCPAHVEWEGTGDKGEGGDCEGCIGEGRSKVIFLMCQGSPTCREGAFSTGSFTSQLSWLGWGSGFGWRLLCLQSSGW